MADTEHSGGGAPPGFYFDQESGLNRYFDGEDWTDKFAPVEPSSTERSDGKDSSVTAVVRVGYVLAVLIPFVGFIIGLTLISRNKHGLGIVLTSVVVFFAWVILLTQAGGGGGGTAMMHYEYHYVVHEYPSY